MTAAPTAPARVVLLLLALVSACTQPPPAPAPPPPPAAAPPAEEPAPEWPDPAVRLTHPVLEVPSGFGTPGVYLSAGHGTRRNVGNVGCNCQLEQDFTLQATTDLGTRLSATGVFDVTLARKGSERPSYGARLRHLKRSGAQAMIELHSDARAVSIGTVAKTSSWGEPCIESPNSPGITVVYSDRGAPGLVAKRRNLARQVGRALTEAGFHLYANYGEKFSMDEQVPGVFVDGRGLLMLKAPHVPSVLIETHNAKHPVEVARWAEPETYDAFARAVTKGLLAHFAPAGAE